MNLKFCCLYKGICKYLQKGNASPKSTEKEKLYFSLEQVIQPSRAFNISNEFSDSIDKG